MLAHAPRATHCPPPPVRRRLHLIVTAPPDFNALIAQVATTRDRAAFAMLFRHFAPRLKAFLMRQGAGAAQAEDLAQESMVNLWRKAHLFDPAKASAATWLFTIARNLRIDAARREKGGLDPNDPMLLPAGEGAPDDGVTAAQGQARLLDALKDLPGEQAQVIEQSFFQDKPHSQIAAELDIPLGTVKSRLRLAMNRLRLALEEGR